MKVFTTYIKEILDAIIHAGEKGFIPKRYIGDKVYWNSVYYR